MSQFRVNPIDPQTRLVLDTLLSDPISKFLVIWITIVFFYFLICFIRQRLATYTWVPLTWTKPRKGSLRCISGSTFRKLRLDLAGEKNRPKDSKIGQNESHKGSHQASVHPEGSRCTPTVYGLRPQEVEGYTAESDDDESDLTQIELRKLQQTDEFLQWRMQKNMRTKDVQEEMEKVFVYKKLRKLHPESFWLLCRPDTLVSIDTVEPGKMLLFLEYMASRCIDIAAFVLTFKYCLAYTGERLTLFQIAASTSVIYWFCVRFWIGGRPSGSDFFSAYYETLGEAEIACKSGPAEVALANIMEDVFVIGTLGLGIIVSLHSRCFSAHAQSIAEKIFGIQIKMEQKRSLCD